MVSSIRLLKCIWTDNGEHILFLGWQPSGLDHLLCFNTLWLHLLRHSQMCWLMEVSPSILITSCWDLSTPGSTWLDPSSILGSSSECRDGFTIQLKGEFKERMICITSGTMTLCTQICSLMRRIWGTSTSDIQIRR